MAVYSVRVESDSNWNVIEIQSAATWARAPGRALSYEVTAGPATGVRLVIEDRKIVVRQTGAVAGPLTLVVQIATAHDRVSLHTEKGRDGTMRLTSAADSRVNDARERETNPLGVVLFLDRSAAAMAGATGGDPALG